MDIKNENNNEPNNKQQQSDEHSDTAFKPKTNEELNEENPA